MITIKTVFLIFVVFVRDDNLQPQHENEAGLSYRNDLEVRLLRAVGLTRKLIKTKTTSFFVLNEVDCSQMQRVELVANTVYIEVHDLRETIFWGTNKVSSLF